MKSMTLEELKHIASKVGKVKGWDFSRIRSGGEPELWEYADVVRQYLKPTDKVLDIGTGGCEVFASLSPFFSQGIAIDHNPEMIEAAQRNIYSQPINNIAPKLMDGSNLQFGEGEFNVVLARHANAYAGEIVRVLCNDGYFIHQSVGPKGTSNILDAFGWTQHSFGPDYWHPVAELAEQFRRLGCHIMSIAESFVPVWFEDLESFIFWLISVPWPEEIDIERHWESINKILETSWSDRGIETNSHEELLIVKKL